MHGWEDGCPFVSCIFSPVRYTVHAQCTLTFYLLSSEILKRNAGLCRHIKKQWASWIRSHKLLAQTHVMTAMTWLLLLNDFSALLLGENDTQRKIEADERERDQQQQQHHVHGNYGVQFGLNELPLLAIAPMHPQYNNVHPQLQTNFVPAFDRFSFQALFFARSFFSNCSTVFANSFYVCEPEHVCRNHN